MFRWTGLAVAALLAFMTPAAAQTLERGRYLVEVIGACGNCHTPKGPQGDLPGMNLAGGMVFDAPIFRAVAPNITPDLETGIGRWTDAQIARAIREGKRPDNTTIGPPMPIEFYRGISDADLAAMVAYLRSVPPVRNAVERSTYSIPLPDAYGPEISSVPPPADNPIARGAYLAGPVGHCLECHTPKLADGRSDMSRAGMGGMEFPGPWGVSVSRNITPHANGIGGWTEAEIVRAITQGVSPSGRQLMPPMGYAYYAKLTQQDLSDLVAYLRSLPPLP